MKLAAVLAAAAATGLFATGAQAQGRSPLPPPGPIEHVAGALYKIFGGGGNTLVFVTDKGVVLVDTKMPGNGPAIMEQVRKVTDKPVVTIINTHNHPDHVGSNDYFRKQFPGVRIISQENTKKWVAANKFYPAADVPDATFKDRTTLGKGKDEIDLYYFGPAHTDGDAFVVFPAEHTLFLGDVMAWNMAPLIDPPTGGTVIGLPDALEKAEHALKDISIVVEGHGYINSWKGFETFVAFNRALLDDAKAAYARHEPPEAAVAELQKNPRFAPLLGDHLLKGLEYGNTPHARALMNVEVAYQQMSGEKVTTNFGGPLPATDKHVGSKGPPPIPGFGPRPGPRPAPAAPAATGGR
jgi:glyoxylase-like metal-dependent hydrolase (beta-lactamase superfamily II)